VVWAPQLQLLGASLDLNPALSTIYHRPTHKRGHRLTMKRCGEMFYHPLGGAQHPWSILTTADRRQGMIALPTYCVSIYTVNKNHMNRLRSYVCSFIHRRRREEKLGHSATVTERKRSNQWPKLTKSYRFKYLPPPFIVLGCTSNISVKHTGLVSFGHLIDLCAYRKV